MSERINDITQKKSRSVRNIQTDGADDTPDDISPPNERSNRWYAGGVWFLLVLVMLFLFFGLSVVFSGTTVQVHPKQSEIQLDESYTAEITPEQEETLNYEIMTISERAGETAEADGQQQVQRYATGTLIVYNNYSSEPLNLVDNTRFESDEGYIYRAQNRTVVPGQHTNAQGQTLPGTTTVTVRAAEPGREYNTQDAEFTVPGLEGSPSYESTYAEVDTAISGGTAGIQKTVSSSTESQIRTNLRNTLENRLFSTAHAQKPDSFILYDDAIFTSFQSLQNQDAGNDLVRIRESGTLKAIIFGNRELARFLANRHLDNYEGGDVRLHSPGDLSFEITNKDSYNPTEKQPVNFTLSGTADLVWQFESTALREDLINQEKSDIQSILANYPSITRAEVIMRPFWKRSFPQNPEEIEIETVLDANSSK
ncbi:MAG: hypothetical protein BRC24_01610 [Parcubacteria group bacterium SW_4_46_8]|nr:MAG: hypothetical protein BRC24_01610 [Parcubacteria group bacterium SW_4_46_8]